MRQNPDSTEFRHINELPLQANWVQIQLEIGVGPT
jgi:hypothetical protein